MQIEHTGILEKTKDKVVAALNGTEDIMTATEKTVGTEMLAIIGNDTGTIVISMTEAIDDVASGALRGAMLVDADLKQVAKGILIGVLRSTKTAGLEVMDAINHTAFVTIRDTATGWGDLEAVVVGLLAGAINYAQEAGISVEEAATAAANGALKAAGLAGSATLELVHQTVTQTVARAQVVLKQPTLAA